ncbi:lipopolysaccharide biosynthesis protein [Caproicibacterium amylolyticum]|uniref:Lipopolysaccharide biosynthesis protein n=1 Tax=Caproicibacterium amylolyticum TaxID=2766537 RepID=A0A7G9WFQ8_9FIRM|nr:lipopolysaccharide biosynthesis protein [Caproicibacterium amylolyticum]QNO17520.1 lipopolysaccharide biosynthesis protein [Caproicibacterium amylolyticum]
MNKYKTLLSNTLIFAVGTFSSKILTILMTRFNTHALGSDFGTASVLQDMGNVLIPLFSLQIVDGITRFGLDRRYNKKDVFTVSLLVTCLGSLGLLLLSPLLENIPGLEFMKGRSMLVAVFVFTSSLRNMCSQFIRARNMVKLYAAEGIFTTFTTVIFTLLFLYPLKMGVTGFMLGIIIPDLIGAAVLFWIAGLHKFIRFRHLNKLTTEQMLKYSAPLIPNKVAFWLTNSADRLMVQSMLGDTVSSVFAGAYKIPNLISLVVSVFLDAWQMSSITEEKGRARFFTKVFHAMTAIVFVGSALVILLCRPLIDVLTSGPLFHKGWVYIPMLVLATAFSCLASFLGTVYMVEKRSVNNMVTTIIAAVVNVVLNVVLIPLWGPHGAAFATFMAYFIMFITRVFDTRRFIHVRFSPLRLTADTVVLGLEAFLMVQNVKWCYLWCSLLTVLMIAINFVPLMQSVRKVLPTRILAKLPAWLTGEPKAAPVMHREPELTHEQLSQDEEYAREEYVQPKEAPHRSRYKSTVDEEDGFDYEAYLRAKEEEDEDFSHDRYRH